VHEPIACERRRWAIKVIDGARNKLSAIFADWRGVVAGSRESAVVIYGFAVADVSVAIVDPPDTIGRQSGTAAPRPRRWRRWVIVAVSVLTLVAAAVVGGGAYFWSSVQLLDARALPSTTTIYYSDGTTVLARLSDIDRTVLAWQDILPVVKQTAVAADDPDFWTDTGGPIARAVVRSEFDARGTSWSGKARRYVLARKLERAYPKEAILESYLNTMSFGRTAYGVEAAAREYFGKSARVDAPADEQLTSAEAILLMAMVDQPYPDPPDRPGYDPTTGAAAAANAQHRWEQIRDAMMSTGALSAADASALRFPGGDVQSAQPGPVSTPSSMVINHVLDELSHTPGTDLYNMPWQQIRNGGYNITTTIDVPLQQAVVRAADETVAGSVMSGQPANLTAAVVVVEPGTGRVLAYYGGHEGSGTDFAGSYVDERGNLAGFGMHQAGSSSGVYTLAAALKAGYSPSSISGHLDSLAASLGAAAISALARDAGIAQISDGQKVYDTATTDPSVFGAGLADGHDRVSVLDQANAMATFAGGGVRARAHFVRTVTQGNQTVYTEPSLQRGADVLSDAQLTDLAAMLASPSVQELPIRTGAAPLTDDPGDIGDAWSIGWSSTLAAAVWVGNRGQAQPLRDRDGNPVSGSTLPLSILGRLLAPMQ
jgi:membrane peptidoglycan carboxypeptidase